MHTLKHSVFVLLLAVSLKAQTGALNVVGGVIDFSGTATSTRPTKTGAALPGTCLSLQMFGRTTDNTMWLCGPDNTWTQFGAAGSGVTTVSWTGGIVSIATPSTTPAFSIAGTSGGVPYFSSASTWASSAAGTSGHLMLWGGAGNPPTDGGVPASAQLHSIGFIIDGGGSVIATGDAKIYPTADFACTINRIDISADKSGSATVDVWKAAGAIPTSGNKISASAPLTLSSAQLAQNGSLTGWTTSVSVGDVFGFNVATATTVTRVIGQIWCQ